MRPLLCAVLLPPALPLNASVFAYHSILGQHYTVKCPIKGGNVFLLETATAQFILLTLFNLTGCPESTWFDCLSILPFCWRASASNSVATERSHTLRHREMLTWNHTMWTDFFTKQLADSRLHNCLRSLNSFTEEKQGWNPINVFSFVVGGQCCSTSA